MLPPRFSWRFGWKSYPSSSLSAKTLPRSPGTRWFWAFSLPHASPAFSGVSSIAVNVLWHEKTHHNPDVIRDQNNISMSPVGVQKRIKESTRLKLFNISILFLLIPCSFVIIYYVYSLKKLNARAAHPNMQKIRRRTSCQARGAWNFNKTGKNAWNLDQWRK